VSRRAVWIGLGLACAVMLVAAWSWFESAYHVLTDRDRVLAWLRGFGAWAPLVFIVLSVLQVIIAPIPGQVIGVAGGYLFGVWAGWLYALIGTMLGSGVAMWLGRRLGRPLAARLVSEETLARFDRFSNRRGAVFFLLVFLLPFAPDDVACFAVGLSPLPLLPMWLMATIVRLPTGMMSVIIGDNIAGLPIGVLMAGVAALVLMVGLTWKYQDRIEGRLMRWITRMADRLER